MVQTLKREFDALAKSNTSDKKQLETETITRVDLENRMKDMKADLAFLSHSHKEVIHSCGF